MREEMRIYIYIAINNYNLNNSLSFINLIITKIKIFVYELSTQIYICNTVIDLYFISVKLFFSLSFSL